jgi:hypothetical protein
MHGKSMKKISLLALLLLAGCYSNGQSGYLVIGPYTPAPHATPAELAASDDATCKSYGAVFGTPDYIQCREHLSDQRQAGLRESPDASAAAMIDAPSPSAPTSTPPTKVARVVRNFCYTDGSERTCTPSQ